MKFVIRDDDLNYFSKPSDIEKLYNDIFAMNIPVGFSTVAFINPIRDNFKFIPQERKKNKEEDREYYIGDNKELIDYVNGNHLMEIMQHGCTHEKKDGEFEYNVDYGLYKETSRAKKELDKLFNKDIKIFVPPHDRISNHGLKALEEEKLDIIKGKGCKNFIFSFLGIKNYIKMIVHKILYPNSFSSPAFPYTLDYGQHKQAYADRLRHDNLKELMYNLEYIHKKNGNFIVTTHLHSFSDEAKENLLKLIKRAKELKADFVYPSSLFSENK